MADERFPEGWSYLSIGELEAKRLIDHHQDGNHGEKHPKSTDYVASGVPFVMARDLENNRLDLEHCAFIPRELAESLRIGFARPGDVLLTHKATMGRVALVPETYDLVLLTPQVTYYRMGKQRGLSQSFLKYAFLGPDFQHQLNSDSDQSTRKYIGITDQKRLKIPVPPEAEQAAISSFLGSLDDKIELNRKMNETLEAMARALFKSWFVDFDPVRAKAKGRPTGLPDHISALFPNSVEDSPLGEIPKGWLVEPIGELTEAISGSTPSTKEPEYWTPENHAWATPKDLSDLTSPVLLKTGRLVSHKGLSQIGSGLLPPGTVLMSSRAPIGYLAIAEIPVAINQGFIAMRPKEGVSNLFLLYWAKASPEIIQSRANGSTFLEISKSSFRQIEVIHPEPAIMRKFDEHVHPWHQRIVMNERESDSLGDIRDALLPKLIAGEIRLKQFTQ